MKLSNRAWTLIVILVIGLPCQFNVFASEPQFQLESEEGESLVLELLNGRGDSVEIRTSDIDSTLVLTHNGAVSLSYSQVLIPQETDSSNIEVSGTITSQSDLKSIGELNIHNIDDQIVFNGQKQWKLVSFDDFQLEKKGWSEQTISSCGTSQNTFLGGHCNFGGISVTKEFTSLPAHTQVNLQLNFHFFDDWNGEFAFVKINGKTVWQESYTWCSKLMVQQCKTKGINVCGKDTPDRLAYPINITFSNQLPSFLLEIGTNLTQNSCEASWGIDDVQVYVK